eukprot:CAMPEP_0197196378 /NCGR_PEP_ID=MMETSP1423-20130617/32324_1 /TAXON_ID=476441 /ORGANISM="Pseudo-nitzschia heimii, Strain UNC1101" /LENGTH=438 /DNA_ID=CAMNT_0042650177 /DNA_START=139 /DNA_END=1456 /DNA_ORIENTATION=-
MPRKGFKKIGRHHKNYRRNPSRSSNHELPSSTESSRGKKRRVQSSIPPSIASPGDQSGRQKRQKSFPACPTKISVTKDLLPLFIQLDELADSLLKKAIAIIRQKIESAVKNSVQVIDVDAIEIEDDETFPVASPPEEEPIVDDDADVQPNTTIESVDSEIPLEEEHAASTTTAPSPVKPRRNIETLIPLNENSFQKSATFILRGARNPEAERKAKSRAVAKIIQAIKDPSLTVEQQVFALREAVRHKELETLSASAGILIDNRLVHYLIKNIKLVLKLATRTRHTLGRASDDMRSIVQTVILAMQPTPGSPKKFSNTEIANFLGMSEPTYRRAVKAVTMKRAALEGIHIPVTPVIFSQVVKRKGWRKVNEELKKTTYDFIFRHPNIIASPIAGDTVTIQDPADPKRKIKVQKMLRQISLRELHNDLIKNVPAVQKMVE